MCPGDNYKTGSFGEELFSELCLLYITKVLEFPGDSVVKTWCFTSISQDLILGWGSNIPQITWYGQKILPKVLLIQFLFFNL